MKRRSGCEILWMRNIQDAEPKVLGLTECEKERESSLTQVSDFDDWVKNDAKSCEK